MSDKRWLSDISRKAVRVPVPVDDCSESTKLLGRVPSPTAMQRSTPDQSHNLRSGWDQRREAGRQVVTAHQRSGAHQVVGGSDESVVFDGEQHRV